MRLRRLIKALRVAMSQNSSKLKPHRKRSGLTQKEVAFLLGGKKHSTISRYEAGERHPDLRTALAFSLLFDQKIDELFPSVRDEAHREVGARAKRLSQEIGQRPDGAQKSYKLEKLAQMQREDRKDAPSV